MENTYSLHTSAYHCENCDARSPQSNDIRWKGRHLQDNPLCSAAYARGAERLPFRDPVASGSIGISYYTSHCDACNAWVPVRHGISWKSEHLKGSKLCRHAHQRRKLPYWDGNAAALPNIVYYASYCECCNQGIPDDMGWKANHMKDHSECLNAYKRNELLYRDRDTPIMPSPADIGLPPPSHYPTSASQSQDQQPQDSPYFPQPSVPQGGHSQYTDQQASSSSSAPQGNTYQQTQSYYQYPHQQYAQHQSQAYEYSNEGEQAAYNNPAESSQTAWEYTGSSNVQAQPESASEQPAPQRDDHQRRSHRPAGTSSSSSHGHRHHQHHRRRRD